MEQGNSHSLILENREKLMLSGVREIVSFDDRAVILYTALGELTVLGAAMQVHTLSTETGELEISGEISALKYGDKDRTAACGLLGRLFR